jgi:hypothetical protein
MNTYGEWRHSSTIPDLGTRWRWVVSFTPLSLYSRGKSPSYPLYRRLGGPQRRSGHCGVEKIFCPFRELKHGNLCIRKLVRILVVLPSILTTVFYFSFNSETPDIFNYVTDISFQILAYSLFLTIFSSHSTSFITYWLETMAYQPLYRKQRLNKIHQT